MKDQLMERDTGSVPKLIEEIKKLWAQRTPDSYLKKLSDSMPKRLQMIIDASGDMTKY